MGRAVSKAVLKAMNTPSCDYCGAQNLHWKQKPDDHKWRLYTADNCLHQCAGAKNANRLFKDSKDESNHPYHN